MHAGIGGQFLAHGLDGLVHGHQPAIGILVRERRRGRWMVLADQQRPDAGLDAIASDHHIRLVARAIAKPTQPLPVSRVLGHIDETLVELCQVPGQQLDQFIQEVRAVHAVLAQTIPDGKRNVLAAALGAMPVAVEIVEPDVLLGGPQIARADALKGVVDARVAGLHGLHGIRGEGDAGADFPEDGGLFVDGQGDVAVVQGDGQGQAGDATADNGDLERL